MAIVFGIAAVCGLLIGTYISRKSQEEKTIQGGMPAQGLHYLACSALSSTTPAVITSIIIGLPFVTMFSIALTFFGSGVVLITLYGFVEASAPISTEELRPQLD